MVFALAAHKFVRVPSTVVRFVQRVRRGDGIYGQSHCYDAYGLGNF